MNRQYVYLSHKYTKNTHAHTHIHIFARASSHTNHFIHTISERRNRSTHFSHVCDGRARACIVCIEYICTNDSVIWNRVDVWCKSHSHGISFNTMNHIQPTVISLIVEPAKPLHSSLNRFVITPYLYVSFPSRTFAVHLFSIHFIQ